MSTKRELQKQWEAVNNILIEELDEIEHEAGEEWSRKREYN